MSWKKRHIKVTAENGAAGGDRAVEPELDARDADFDELGETLDDENSDNPPSVTNQGNEGSANEFDELLQKYKAESAENHDKYLRALADFENYKKRALKERSDLLKYQGEKILADMLDVGDNLELALQHADADPEKLRDGVKLISKMFMDILARWEVRPASGLGKPFDPASYNAISRVPAAGQPAGTIVGELKKAYFYKDRLLRVGEVVVAAEVVAQANDDGE